MAEPTILQALLIVATGFLTFFAVVFGVQYLIGQISPEHEVQVRGHLQRLFPIVSWVVVTTAFLWPGIRPKTYVPGDDPLSLARVMTTLGKREIAIRYLESVPFNHPSAPQVRTQIKTLRERI